MKNVWRCGRECMRSPSDAWSAIRSVGGMALCTVIAMTLASCSVGMAVSGEEDPNLANCHVGAEIHEIERELGPPTNTRKLDDGGTECTYEYELGNEPSAGRAVAHGAMDVLTLGLWEIVGTPVEATQGSKYEMTVVYGPDGKATEITSRRLE